MNFKNILTVFKREIGAYFNSAIATIYLIVFIAINNGFFLTHFFLMGRADMRSFFENLPLVLLIFIPVVTMRLWAEDRKENTFELLMTFPMRPLEIVIGKYIASLAFYAIALISTWTIPVMMFFVGAPDKGMMASGYLGALMVGALFLAVGIFISGLTKEQIVAFVLTVLSCFFLYFLGTDFSASVIDGWIAGFGTFLMSAVGVTSHLNSFWKGVIDFKDILYFVVTIGVFLFLNSLFFEGRYRPKSRLVFSAAVAAGISITVVFGAIVGDMTLGRFDLTEGKTYTVSPASRRILRGLKSPVWINAYVTPVDKMPTVLKTLEQDIVGKLEELRIASNAKLNYKVTHIEAAKLMEKKSKDGTAQEGSLEATLQNKGITPFQVESIDRDELGVKLVYAALTIDYKEKNQEILPRILPQTLPDLEYLLLSRVVKLTLERKPKVAYFAPLLKSEVTPQMTQLMSSLGKDAPQYEDRYKSLEPLLQGNGFVTSRISLTRESGIPYDTDVLLVLNPGSLNDRQIYEINKYLYQGGKAFIAAQGYEYSFQMRTRQGVDVVPKSLPLDINNLTEKWGVKINPDMLLDENNDIINVSLGQRVGQFALQMPVRVPTQILIRQETMNRKLPLMSRQPTFFYLWGSALDIFDDAIKQTGIKSTVLFTSGARSWKFASASLDNGALTSNSVAFPRSGVSGKYPLGVVLEGSFPNNYPDGASEWPASGESAVASDKKVKEELKANPGKLVLIGCSQMFTDDLIVNPPNLGLFANIIDALTLGDDVVQIRAKTLANRDIKKLNDAERVGLRFFAVMLVPVLWAAFSFVRLFLRRKEKQFYMVARGR
jgi:ABC-2 type transport system permease protein